MRPSPSGWRLGPRGYSFSRPQRVYLCYGPVTRSLPWGDLVDRLQSFSFHHLCYPNYGALTSTPAGLSPAEHASLRWTHNRTGESLASGSRTRLHTFTHGTSCPSAVKRTSHPSPCGLRVAGQPRSAGRRVSPEAPQERRETSDVYFLELRNGDIYVGSTNDFHAAESTKVPA